MHPWRPFHRLRRASCIHTYGRIDKRMLRVDVAAPQRWELYRVLSEPARLRLLALAAEEELSIGGARGAAP